MGTHLHLQINKRLERKLNGQYPEHSIATQIFSISNFHYKTIEKRQYGKHNRISVSPNLPLIIFMVITILHKGIQYKCWMVFVFIVFFFFFE